jgi:peptidoglycan lytic transglycosylase
MSYEHLKKCSRAGKLESILLHKLQSLLAATVFVLAGTLSVQAQSEEENGAFLAAAISQAEEGNWEVASALAGRVSDPVAGDIITWMRLRKGEGEFQEYTAFLARNPDWPGLNLLRIKGEGAISEAVKPSQVIAYFKTRRPQSGTGVVRLTEAYLASGNKKAAEAEALRAWRGFSMGKDDRIALYKSFGKTLKKHNIERLDMLLWRNQREQAEALYSEVPEGYVALAKARLALRKRAKGVNKLIDAVPKSLRDDPGLSYERFIWRARKDLKVSARDLLIERSVSAEKLGQPARWASRRRTIARAEMREGNNQRAYKIASQHFLTKGSDYADLEWLSGFIALRKFNDPKTALKHFQRFRAAVQTPISFGRAGYWQGRAYEALGDKANAQAAYEFAAGYQTSFYGQLAAEKIGAKPDKSLAGREKSPNWREADFLNTTVFRAAILLHYADNAAMTEQFIRQIAKGQERTGYQQLADIAMEIGRPNIAVRLSKQAARKGYILPKTYFPVTELAKYVSKVKPEEAMSIARRESELDQYIISPAGARGLMQIMPRTAKKVAKEIGVEYSKDKLTSEWKYNARLGSTYLAEQLADFNGSYILAFAAYNAGPSRARKWIELYGDPRQDNVDQIDWIEHIPFRETRNYVMRVVESLHVYRARIKGRTPKLKISKDLKKG